MFDASCCASCQQILIFWSLSMTCSVLSLKLTVSVSAADRANILNNMFQLIIKCQHINYLCDLKAKLEPLPATNGIIFVE